MGLWGKLKSFVENRAGGDLLGALYGFFPSGNDSGINASYQNALTLASVWRALSILSDAFVGLPPCVFDSKTKAEDETHPISKLMRNDGEANEYMSAVAAKSAMMLNIGLWGNGYAYIARDESYKPIGFYPLNASLTYPRRINGNLVYFTRTTESFTIAPQDILHVLGPLTMDGIVGLSPIEYARQTVGLSISLEKFAAKFFGQGGNIGGIIETPAMTKEARDKFIETWKQTYTGPDSAFKIAALPGGMKFTRTTAEPDEAQALESRVHQKREIATIWGIPPHMLGDLEKADYATIEQQNIGFYSGTIHPYVTRFEAEISRKMLAENEKGRLSVRFNMDEKLRATTLDRYQSYNLAITGGWMKRNEARQRENLPPIDGGDTVLEPLNMKPIGGPGANVIQPETAKK